MRMNQHANLLEATRPQAIGWAGRLAAAGAALDAAKEHFSALAAIPGSGVHMADEIDNAEYVEMVARAHLEELLFAATGQRADTILRWLA